MDNRNFGERMKNEIRTRTGNDSWDKTMAQKILKKRSDKRRTLVSGFFALVLFVSAIAGFFYSSSNYRDIPGLTENEEYNLFHELVTEDSVDLVLNAAEIVQN